MTFSRRIARALPGVAFTASLFSALLVSNFGCTPSTIVDVRTNPDPLSCGTLPQARINPLMQINDPLVVRPITVDDLPGPRDDYEPDTDRRAGVAVDVPAQPGWTRTWLERRLLCYQKTADPADVDPLLVPGAQIGVLAKQGHFQVTIASEEAESAEQIAAAAVRFPMPRPVAAAR